MKNTLLITNLLLVLLLQSKAMAYSSIESRDEIQLPHTESKGEVKVHQKESNYDYLQGQSKGYGYKIDFKDNKAAHLKLWGFARMYAVPKSSSKKVYMPYFRLYFEGQKNSEWGFLTRLDYTANGNGGAYKTMTGDSEVDGSLDSDAPGIYYARAYFKYTPKAIPGLSVNIGRILNQSQKFDVIGYSPWAYGATKGTYSTAKFGLTNTQYGIGEGVEANYRKGGFSAKAVVSYRSGTGSATTSANNTELFTYTGRVGYAHTTKLGTIGYDVAGLATSHKDTDNKYLDIMPNFYFWAANGIWFFDQMLIRDMIAGKPGVSTDEYKMLFKNYAEIGKSFNIFGVKCDIDTYISTTHYDGTSSSEVGLESYITIKDDLKTFVSFSYDDVFNEMENPENPSNDLSRVGITAFIQKYF